MTMLAISPSFHKVCTIARRLRYRTLEGAIGRSVRVTSEATAEADVLDGVDRS